MVVRGAFRRHGAFGADAPDAFRGRGPCPEREPDDPGRRAGGCALRLREAPDMGRPASADHGRGQLYAFDREVGDARGSVVRRRQHVCRAGRPFAAALRAVGLPHAAHERHADGCGRGIGPGVAHHAGRRGEEDLLQHPSRRTVARGAPRIGGHGAAHGRRHRGAVPQRPGLGVRPAHGAGAVEQPAPYDPSDRELDQALEAAAEDVPFGSGGCGTGGRGFARRHARRGARGHRRADDRPLGEYGPPLARAAGGAAAPFAACGQCRASSDARGLRDGLLYG